MADKETSVDLTKLNEDNYSLWLFGIKILLQSEDLMAFAKGDETAAKPDKATKASDWAVWNKKQSRTAVILLSSIEKRLHGSLINCDGPAEMWTKIESLYGISSEDAKQSLWVKFYNFRFQDGVKMKIQVEEFENIIKKIKDAGEKISESAIIGKLLSSLPARFSSLCTAWESTAKDEQKLSNLIARIIREDTRLAAAAAVDDFSSLVLQVQKLHMKKQGKCREERKREIEDLKKRTKCAYCGERGHWVRECPARLLCEKRDGEYGPTKSADAFICDLNAFCSNVIDTDGNIWYADSGASMHMTFKKEYFTSLKPVNSNFSIKVADNKVLPATAMGTILIREILNRKVVVRELNNVLLVPGLKRNLLSIGTINDKNFTFHSYKNRCEILDSNGRLASSGVRYGKLFRMLFTVIMPNECNLAADQSCKVDEINEIARLWHQRMGHVSVHTVQRTGYKEG